MEYAEREAQAMGVYAQWIENVKTKPMPIGQKFPVGSRVRIKDDLGVCMGHFPSGKLATVEYTYAHAYWGDNVKDYSLIVDGLGSVAWYHEDQLEAVDQQAIESLKRRSEMERTTDIEKLKNGGAFTWGEVVKIHEIGEYIIAEYHPWITDGCTVKTGQTSALMTEYHIWINGSDTSRDSGSLDSAIAEAIAYKHDGANSQAGSFFMRMISED